jgi:hypothetical protein
MWKGNKNEINDRDVRDARQNGFSYNCNVKPELKWAKHLQVS